MHLWLKFFLEPAASFYSDKSILFSFPLKEKSDIRHLHHVIDFYKGDNLFINLKQKQQEVNTQTTLFYSKSKSFNMQFPMQLQHLKFSKCKYFAYKKPICSSR